MERIAKELVTSLVTVVIAILAIAIFISSGSTIVFYVTVFIAIIVGMYNMWLISATKPKKVSTTRRAKRRKR